MAEIVLNDQTTSNPPSYKDSQRLPVVIWQMIQGCKSLPGWGFMTLCRRTVPQKVENRNGFPDEQYLCGADQKMLV
jgi:hypothetical protein